MPPCIWSSMWPPNLCLEMPLSKMFRNGNRTNEQKYLCLYMKGLNSHQTLTQLEAIVKLQRNLWTYLSTVQVYFVFIFFLHVLTRFCNVWVFLNIFRNNKVSWNARPCIELYVFFLFVAYYISMPKSNNICDIVWWRERDHQNPAMCPWRVPSQ